MSQPSEEIRSSEARPNARLMNIREAWTSRGIALDYRPAQVRMLNIADAVALGVKFGMADSNERRVALTIITDVAAEYRGFAWEGVAMAWTLVDLGRAATRLDEMRAGRLALNNHNWRNWIWVGLGLGLAQGLYSKGPSGIAALVELTLDARDPQCVNLIADGVAYALAAAQPDVWAKARGNPFDLTESSVDLQTIHAARRGFDQGLGRAIWFLDCGEPEQILKSLEVFSDSSRAADIWGGVGYAGTFSGGAPVSHWHPLVEKLQHQTGTHGWLSQAVACAANARQRTQTPDSETLSACIATWGMNPEQVIDSMNSWLSDPTEASPARAPGQWRHSRVPLEFGVA